MLVRLLSRAVRDRSSVLVHLRLVHTQQVQPACVIHATLAPLLVAFHSAYDGIGMQAQYANQAECEPWQSKGQPIEHVR